MIIKITNEKERINAQEMVDLLGITLLDELQIAEFILDKENTLRLVKQDNNTMTPSEVIEEVKRMADLITENDKAERKAIKNKNWDLALPLDESKLALKYKDDFSFKYNVFYAEVLDRMYKREI